ncbi:signal peptidase I [Nocardioides eburneus]
MAARLQKPWSVVPVLILLAALLALVVACGWDRGGFESRFTVDDDSMAPSYPKGSVVSATAVHDYRGRRGDVVVFNTPDGWPRDVGPTGRLIRRVIGTGGDTVACCDGEGRILVNGDAVDEPYLQLGSSVCAGPVYQDIGASAPSSCGDWSVVVPDGRLFAMGDDRFASGDSSYRLCSSPSQRASVANDDHGTCHDEFIPVTDVVGTVSSDGGVGAASWATIVWALSWLWFIWALIRFRRSMPRAGDAGSFESATSRAIEGAPAWVVRERERILLAMRRLHRLQRIEWWTRLGQVAWWLVWPIWWPVTSQALWPAALYSWAFYALWNWYSVWFWRRRVAIRPLEERSQWGALIASGLTVWLLFTWPSAPVVIWPLVGMLVLDCGVWGCASEWVKARLMSPFAACTSGTRRQASVWVNGDTGRPNLAGHHWFRCSALSRRASRKTVGLAVQAALARNDSSVDVQGAFKLKAMEMASAASIDLADVWDKDPARMSRQEADVALTFALGGMWAAQ